MLCFALNVKLGILNIDPYVKVVLTVIAVCLVVIAFKPVFVTEAEAQGQVVDVRIVGIDEAQHLRWESIPVKVKDWNVRIEGGGLSKFSHKICPSTQKSLCWVEGYTCGNSLNNSQV